MAEQFALDFFSLFTLEVMSWLNSIFAKNVTVA